MRFEKSPGVYTEAQVAGWRRVVDSVHAAGGRIVCQLWHGGRVSAKGLLGGRQPMAPSAVNDDLDALQVWALLANGAYVKISATRARAMETSEVEEIVGQYRQAAANAWSAGFDGVEVHAGNGYLPHQFLSPTTNRRSDRYGGSTENRARFLRDVVAALGEVMPMERIGVRLSPTAEYNNPRHVDPHECYRYVAAMLEELKAGFIEIADTNAWAKSKSDRQELLAMIRPNYRGCLILNGGLDAPLAEELLASGQIDLASFGRSFLANPDLPVRIARQLLLTDAHPSTWYGGGGDGYTDYESVN